MSTAGVEVGSKVACSHLQGVAYRSSAGLSDLITSVMFYYALLHLLTSS